MYRVALDAEGNLGGDRVADRDIEVEFLFAGPGFIAVKDEAGAILFVPE